MEISRDKLLRLHTKDQDMAMKGKSQERNWISSNSSRKQRYKEQLCKIESRLYVIEQKV